jgi:hypothetical protein
MNTITLQSSAAPHASAAVIKTSVPFYLYITVLSSLSIIIGLIWDISWHMSIGRDGLFSAPHLAIYLGGVTAGIFSGYRILKLTFAGSAFERGKAIKFWGIFYGSLGNMFCVWGAIAMLTSAPFDDWWHNTYGLDVTILSPPHTVLLLGMITIQFGAIISVLAYQNLNAEHIQQDHISNKGFTILFALSGGFVLTMLFTIASEYLSRHDMHGVLFYQVASLLFPLFLTAFSVSSRSKWGATQAALVYTIFLMVMNWILPLFPATPRLGPVLNPITTFQPFEFPLLIIIPSIMIDVITHRFTKENRWLRALVYGSSFLIILLIVQWPFANVLMASRGHWFFGTSKWYFGSDPNWAYRYEFGDWMVSSGINLIKGIAIALLIAILSARTGLAWGHWMKKIMR